LKAHFDNFVINAPCFQSNCLNVLNNKIVLIPWLPLGPWTRDIHNDELCG